MKLLRDTQRMINREKKRSDIKIKTRPIKEKKFFLKDDDSWLSMFSGRILGWVGSLFGFGQRPNLIALVAVKHKAPPKKKHKRKISELSRRKNRKCS